MQISDTIAGTTFTSIFPSQLDNTSETKMFPVEFLPQNLSLFNFGAWTKEMMTFKSMAGATQRLYHAWLGYQRESLQGFLARFQEPEGTRNTGKCIIIIMAL